MYLPVLQQWRTVESYFASEYRITAREMLTELSWRRFRVLLARGFEWTTHSPNVAEGFDWQRALDKSIGRETPSRVRRMTPDEFLRLK